MCLLSYLNESEYSYWSRYWYAGSFHGIKKITGSLQAIENFALTVKEMAQMLQSFGTELAEMELPGDIPSIEEILALRAEKYHMLKVRLMESASNR